MCELNWSFSYLIGLFFSTRCLGEQKNEKEGCVNSASEHHITSSCQLVGSIASSDGSFLLLSVSLKTKKGYDSMSNKLKYDKYINVRDPTYKVLSNKLYTIWLFFTLGYILILTYI